MTIRGAQSVHDNSSYIESDGRILESDPVSDVVAEYGEFDTKIESISQLRRIDGIRAEVAMLSLGRGYVRRCVARGGQWTSGLHMLAPVRARRIDGHFPSM